MNRALELLECDASLLLLLWLDADGSRTMPLVLCEIFGLCGSEYVSERDWEVWMLVDAALSPFSDIIYPAASKLPELLPPECWLSTLPIFL